MIRKAKLKIDNLNSKVSSFIIDPRYEGLKGNLSKINGEVEELKDELLILRKQKKIQIDSLAKNNTSTLGLVCF